MKNEVKSRHRKIDILYEDDYICILNKPAGILSVPNQSKDKSVLGILEEIMRKNGNYSAKHRPFAVHRLDKETSGVMMFALTESVQKKIMDSWHTMVSERLYRAVAENPQKPKKELPDSGLIDDNLAYNARNIAFVPQKTETGEEKNTFKTVPARTEYKTILRGKSHTLFELSLDTGKKNQIRAHLASKGYPLAGDINFRAKTNKFGRLCLHARTLEFSHPETGKKMRFEIPEPKEWLLYVEKGEARQNKALEKRKSSKKANPLPARRRLSAKEKAHMNFIEQGKFRLKSTE